VLEVIFGGASFGNMASWGMVLRSVVDGYEHFGEI
jgi:hypothetical protein